MRVVELNKITELQGKPERIRNICILAHVDHGKTTLADSLVASNGIISSKMAGKLRYMDSRKDEQERGITMKSSGITLVHSMNCTDYLVNLMDSPGHVDFSSEVSTAIRLCDGAVVIVDVVEGVCPQTKVALQQTWLEHMKPVLVLNKIDRYIVELKLSPLDAFIKLTQVLEQVNAAMGELFAADVMAKEDAKRLNPPELHEHGGYEWSDGLEDADDDHLYFSPDQGNVCFASAVDGWAFQLKDFAKLYSNKLGVKESVLMKTLWGDYYLSSKEKKVMKGAQNKAKKPLFVQLVLDNIWQLYEAAVLRRDKQKVEKMAATLNLKLTTRDLRHTDGRVQLQALCSQWLPLAPTVLDMVCKICPSPKELLHEKAELLMCSRNLQLDSLPPETQAFHQHLLACDSSDNAPLVAFVSKMFPVDKVSLPENRQRPLTAEEIAERRELARRRHETMASTEERVVVVDGGSDGGTETVTEKTEDDNEYVFIGLARVFSGTLRAGQEVLVLGPKHSPSLALEQVDAGSVVLGRGVAELGSDEHVTRARLSRLYLVMGRDLEEVQEAPAGCVVGVAGLTDHVLSTATLADSLACVSFAPLTQIVVPIVRVAVEPSHPADLPALVRGLKLLNQADPGIQVLVQETGEHVLVTAGEVHLEKCLEDLRERYAKVPVTASAPIVPFRETVVPPPTVDMVNEAIDTLSITQIKDKGDRTSVSLTTANRQVRIRLRAAPLPSNVTNLLESSADLIKSVLSCSKLSPDGRQASDLIEPTEESEAAHLAGKTRKEWEELRSELTQHLHDSGAEFTVDDIWAYGPRQCGPNVLVCQADYRNNIPLQYHSSFCNGFQMATLAGPLCDEPMMGVAFIVEEWHTTDEDVVQGASFGPLSGQIMSCVKEGCRKAFQAQPQRIMAAMYSCSIQVNAEVLGKMYAVLARRHGRVLHGDVTQGSAMFNVTAVLPVIESFAFAPEIRKQTSGLAIPQLVFSHWEVIDLDPFWVPRTEEEYLHFGEKADSENRVRKYVDSVRRRKGLAVEQKIVEFAEKQRTLSKNK